MNALPKNAVLLLIDVQKGFADPQWGERNNPQAEANMARLLTAWRATGRPVYHVQHLSVLPDSPLNPKSPGVEIQDAVAPLENEQLFQKNVNSAFIGTTLEATLRENGCDTLVIVGLTTQHCVSTTTRMAGNLGFETFLVGDGTAAFATAGLNGEMISAETVHQTELALLHGEFATVVSTELVLSSL